MPEKTCSSSRRSSLGGGLSENAFQYRHSITYGSSHALTLLNAAGQHIRDRGLAFLFPPLRLCSGGGRDLFRVENPPWQRLPFQKGGASPPAEGEGAAYEVPVAPYGDVFSDLVVGLSQRVLHLLVALLYPAS